MPDSRYRPSRRSRSRSGSRSRSDAPTSVKRLHLADLNEHISRRDVEDAFGRFGRISDVWVASYPPYYGFVVFERSDDASNALKEMRRGYIGKYPIRTTIALPRGTRKARSPARRYRDDDRFSRRDRDDRYGRDRYYSDRERDRRYKPRESLSPRRRSRSPQERRKRSPEPDVVSD